MGLVGSAGALASFFVLPQLGAMYDAAKVEFAGGPEAFAALTGAAKLAVEDAAASLSFQRLAIPPLILPAVFGFVWLRARGKSRGALPGEAGSGGHWLRYWRGATPGRGPAGRGAGRGRGA